MNVRAVALSCMVMAAACQPAEETDATETTTESSIAEDKAALDQLRNDWVAAAERDDAAAVAALYSDNAVFLGNDGSSYVGREAIQAALAESFKVGSGLTVTEVTSESAGNVVYSTGDYTQKVTTPDGKTADASGSYLVISRKQADGSWKIVRHVSLLKPAPAAM